jgi:hypothetical protein
LKEIPQMIINRSALVVLIAQILISFGCYGQVIYYVNGTSGNDAASGLSQLNAWKTIQKACDNATPGSKVLISGGIYNEQPELNVSGIPGNPIVFEGIPGELVIIDGSGLGGSTMLTIFDQSYLHFRNLTIRNLLRNFAVGILVETTENGHVTDVSFEKLIITNINWTNDPTIMPGPGNNSNPFLFYGTGLSQANTISGIVVDSCEIFNNITGYSENLTLNGNVEGAVITNNSIHNNRNIGICIAGNYNACSVPALDHARNVDISGNEVYYNISQAATSAGIYVDGGRKVLIEHNRAYHNGVGIEIGCERDGITDSCTVRDNIVFDNLDWGVGVGGYDPATTGQVRYTSVTNNTLYKNTVNNSGMGEFYMPKASQCSFINNIIFTSSQNVFLTFDPINPQQDNTFDYNCWYSPGNDPSAVIVNWRGETLQSFSAYQTATGFDVHSFYGNPLFLDPGTTAPDFVLDEGSPCINTGDPAFVLHDGETDFVGFPRIYDSRIDVGSFEYQGPNSTDELEESEQISVSPNPCKTEFIIRGLKTGAVVRILDMQGRMIMQIYSNSNCYSVEGIERGIYLIKVLLDAGKTLERKLIIESL